MSGKQLKAVEGGILSASFNRKIRLSFRINILFIAASLPFSIVFQLMGFTGLAISVVIFNIFFSFSLALTWYRYQILGRLLMLMTGTTALVFYSLILGENAGVQYISISFAAIPFVLFDKKEEFWAYLSSFFTITTFFMSWHLNYSHLGYLSMTLSGLSRQIIFVLMTLVAFIFSIGSVFFYKKSSTRFEYDLQNSNTNLQATITQLTQETQDKEAALIREHKKAEKIKAQAKKIKTHALEIQEKQVQEKLLKQAGNYQQLLFQESIPQPHNQTISVFGSASHYITGDYRYIAQITDYISGLIVLDVTGHGAPAAMMTGILSKDVDCLFETSSPDLLTDTGATMKVLNKTFTRERRLSKLIAGVYAVVDTQQNVVHVTCAGSETAMIYRDGKILSIKNANESLRMDEDCNFSSITLPIQSGDIIIVCSDGLMDRKLKDGSPLFLAVEAEGDYDEEAGEYPEILLDYTQFEAILSKWPQQEALAEYLGETLDQLCQPASDDMTIIAVEIA